MSQKLMVTCLLVSSILLYSCGPSKKMKAANANIARLEAANKDLTAKVSQLQGQVDNLTASNNSLNQQYNSYKTDCEATKQKLASIEASRKEDYNRLMEIQKKVEAATADFEGKGLEVTEKDGEIYVNMQDNLLYKSGSSTVGEEGKKVLANLASVLNDYPKLEVTVMGHTDDQKFKSSNTDNLSLSTERANGVARILRDNQVDPNRLTSAGKGKFDPVADNATAEGRAKNRRTEIILNPDFLRAWEETGK